MSNQKLIKSISFDQSEIIKDILELHVPHHQIDLDPTYSIGNFYINTGIEPPRHKFDINPQLADVQFGDSRSLPLPDGSITCEMFDPPFLATTGASLSKKDTSNIINKRFGVYPNGKEMTYLKFKYAAISLIQNFLCGV